MEEAAVASREIFGNIGTPAYILYFLALLAIIFFARAIFEWVCLWRVGKSHTTPFGSWWRRIWEFVVVAVVDGLLHRGIFGFKHGQFKEFYPGIIHFLIFWGCFILLLGAGLDFISHYIIFTFWDFQFLEGTRYFIDSLVIDAFGLLVVVGAILAVIRRYAQRPDRLDNTPDDLITLGLLLGVVITGFFVEGFRVAATELTPHPDWAKWSIGGFAVANMLGGMSEGVLLDWHRALWWFHSLLALGAVVYVSISFSKFRHIIVAPINVFFRSLGPKGVLVPIELETAESFGVNKITDFTWKQLMDLDACTRCGRCQDNCPAYLSGKALSPKKMTQDLKTNLVEEGVKKGGWLWFGKSKSADPENLIGEVVTEEEIWDCTTCRACQEVCPVYVEHIDRTIDMRRNLVLEQAKMPETAEGALRSIETRGHPWRGTTATRTDWAEGLDVKLMSDDSNVDILYWVGCTAALEDRSTKIAIAMAKILKAANVNFAILGSEETCCGDPARRMGNEYLFQMQVMSNVETLKGYNVKKIVTACPHCFHSLKNEYPQFGGEFEVIHHTQFISQLLSEGRLRLSGELKDLVTYHDPCYLGRYNDVYEPPRQVLGAIPGVKVVEMERRRERSFCCGGGGGHMWIEENVGQRINVMRTEQVIETGAGVVATACPFCLQMFEDAIKAKEKEETLRTADLAELVAAVL